MARSGIAGMLGEPTYQDDSHRVPLFLGGWLMKFLQGGLKAKPFNVKDFVDKREFILSLIGQSSKQKNKRILAEMLEESEKIRKNPSFKFPDTNELKKKIWKDITKDITKHADGGRVPFKDAKLVEGEPYIPPTTHYNIGIGSIINQLMGEGVFRDEEGFHTTLNKKDLEYLWEVLKGEHPIEDIEDKLMLRISRMDPEEKAKFYIGIGKDQKEIGFKKEIDFNKMLMKKEGGRVPLKGGYLAEGYKDLRKKYKGSDLKAIISSPEINSALLGHWGIQELLTLMGFEKGGRVGLQGGGIPGALLAALRFLMQKYGKDVVKLAKDVKPSKKWDTQKAIQAFKDRNPQFRSQKINDLGGSKADPFSKNFDFKAEADLIAKTSFKPVELKRLFGNQIDDNILREIAAMNPAKQLKAIEQVKLYLKNRKNLKQELTLRDFDVTGKKGHASGGLAAMLGE